MIHLKILVSGMADAEGENPENVITEREVIPASSIPLEKYGKPTGKRKNSGKYSKGK